MRHSRYIRLKRPWLTMALIVSAPQLIVIASLSLAWGHGGISIFMASAVLVILLIAAVMQ